MADISKIITPDGEEYNIKDTTARGLVVANPTLAGTESDLAGLQVNGTKYKIPSGGGSSISPYASNPAMDSTASPGSSANYARGDHVHPHDTGIESLIAPVETGATASRQYLTGQIFIKDETIYRAKTNISQGSQFSVGTNIEVMSLADIISHIVANQSNIKVGWDGYSYIYIDSGTIEITTTMDLLVQCIMGNIRFGSVPVVGNNNTPLALRTLGITGASAGAPVVVSAVDSNNVPTAYTVGHPLTTHETWTFTLADGTTVTKDVVIW